MCNGATEAEVEPNQHVIEDKGKANVCKTVTPSLILKPIKGKRTVMGLE